MDKIDCKGDPQAGAKIIWNFDYQWEGDGTNSRYYYSYWDRGEELPLYYEGTAKTVRCRAASSPSTRRARRRPVPRREAQEHRSASRWTRPSTRAASS